MEILASPRLLPQRERERADCQLASIVSLPYASPETHRHQLTHTFIRVEHTYYPPLDITLS